jgi:hypothetical protein
MMVKICSTALVITACMVLEPFSAGAAGPQPFSWQDGHPVADSKAGLRGHEASVQPMNGMVYVYATFDMGSVNPLKCIDGRPQWRENGKSPAVGERGVPSPSNTHFIQPEPAVTRSADQPQNLQIVTLGEEADGKFTPAVRFGLADDGRAQAGMAHLTPWVNDGFIDYFGAYARPDTQYDFKIRLDLNGGRMTVWVSGRGDDDWFLLAENASLVNNVRAIDHVQVLQYPDAPAIRNLRVAAEPIPAAEAVRPHPMAKKDRTVASGRGFRFQSMRSTWRKPGKQVTIFRKPGVHAAFTDVAQAGPNHLVCVWRNGSHTGGTGGLSLAHSYDLGKTWTEPALVSSLPGNCPRIQRVKDGTLLLLVDVPSSENQFTATWNLVLWDSIDGGKTWSNERWLMTEKVGGGGCIVPSRICETADGSWLLSASYFAKPENGGQYVEILDYYRSDDRGKTWKFVSQPNHYPPFCLSEPSPVQLPDGRLMVYARESNQHGMPGAKGYSTDGGMTWRYQELPHPITGRTCAGLLRDGRVMNTFRSGVGRAALRAWIGDPDDPTTPQPAGSHFNDRTSVGLKDGALSIDNDGIRGQFTKYNFRPPDTEKSTVDLTAEVKVISNHGRAATISLPFAGKLRIFPDHAVMAHDSTLRVDVAPGKFHTYRAVSQVGRLQLYVDGAPAFDTDKGDGRLETLGWTKASIFSLGFGNEAAGKGAALPDEPSTPLDVFPVNITPEATGCSVWRRVEIVLDDPATGRRELSWRADRDGFPDQYQLDHIIEVEASAAGHDQGYSGWTQLDDGRIFVVHYTDDGSSVSLTNPHSLGVPWIRGTFLSPDDLPPTK